MPQEIKKLWPSLPIPSEYEDMDIDTSRLNFFEYTGLMLLILSMLFSFQILN